MKKQNLIIKNTKHGRGVFSSKKIKKGQLIEEAHSLSLSLIESKGVTLSRYVFEYDDKTVLLALGNGSLYNHNFHPNAEAVIDSDKIIRFYALKDISANTEITISYGYSKVDYKKLGIV